MYDPLIRLCVMNVLHTTMLLPVQAQRPISVGENSATFYQTFEAVC